MLLELSEHDQVEDYDALTATLAPLRAGGLRLAIDDVGAGFSSLRHIVVTSPDVIKIDRRIVAGLDTDPVLTKLVQSLVEFGHGYGVRVVAEGTETDAEAAALRALGVDYGQGWHYGRPGPPQALSDDGRVVPVPHPRSDTDGRRTSQLLRCSHDASNAISSIVPPPVRDAPPCEANRTSSPHRSLRSPPVTWLAGERTSPYRKRVGRHREWCGACLKSHRRCNYRRTSRAILAEVGTTLFPERSAQWRAWQDS